MCPYQSFFWDHIFLDNTSLLRPLHRLTQIRIIILWENIHFWYIFLLISPLRPHYPWQYWKVICFLLLPRRLDSPWLLGGPVLSGTRGGAGAALWNAGWDQQENDGHSLVRDIWLTIAQGGDSYKNYEYTNPLNLYGYKEIDFITVFFLLFKTCLPCHFNNGEKNLGYVR